MNSNNMGGGGGHSLKDSCHHVCVIHRTKLVSFYHMNTNNIRVCDKHVYFFSLIIMINSNNMCLANRII